MQILFTPLAERQLERLFDYIALHSSEATAESYIRRIVNHCNRLQRFPKRGTARDDILSGLRTVGFERRVTIAFMVREDVILIEGIFYGGQDFEAALRPN